MPSFRVDLQGDNVRVQILPPVCASPIRSLAVYVRDLRRLAHLAPALTLALVSACSNGEKSATPGARDSTAATAAAPATACPTTDAALTLPDGFCAAVVADSISQ